MFLFTNGLGHPYMATGKNHSIQHTPNYVSNYCDSINYSMSPIKLQRLLTMTRSHGKVSAQIKVLGLMYFIPYCILLRIFSILNDGDIFLLFRLFPTFL